MDEHRDPCRTCLHQGDLFKSRDPPERGAPVGWPRAADWVGAGGIIVARSRLSLVVDGKLRTKQGASLGMIA